MIVATTSTDAHASRARVTEVGQDRRISGPRGGVRPVNYENKACNHTICSLPPGDSLQTLRAHSIGFVGFEAGNPYRIRFSQQPSKADICNRTSVLARLPYESGLPGGGMHTRRPLRQIRRHRQSETKIRPQASPSQVPWMSCGACSGLIKRSSSASTLSAVSTKSRGTSCRSLCTRGRQALAVLARGIRGKQGTPAIRCSERPPDARPSESRG